MRDTYLHTGDQEHANYEQGKVDGLLRAIEVIDFRERQPRATQEQGGDK